MDPIAILSRLLHVMTAIVMLGGATYVLLVLMPAARDLPDDVHEGLRNRLALRWRKLVMIGSTILVLTGLYNYLVVARPLHSGDGPYHMLMGIKILLALAVLFLAAALVGRSQGLAWIRRDPRKWLSVLVVTATIVVAIASVLKVRGVVSQPPGQSPPAPTASGD